MSARISKQQSVLKKLLTLNSNMGSFTKTRMVLLIAVLLLPPVFVVSVHAYENPGAPVGFANDLSGTLSSMDRQALETKLSGYAASSGNEVVVAIIPSLGGDTIENFANQLFKDWGIGKEKKDNGVLLFVAKEDREMRIEVGYGLEGDLTDIQSEHIITDTIAPYFKQSDFVGGVNAGVDAIIATLSGGVVPPVPSSNNPPTSPAQDGSFSLIPFFLLFGIVWLTSILGRSKSWWAGGIIGAVLGFVILFFEGTTIGIIAITVLSIVGLIFDFVVSSAYQKHGASGGTPPWWAGGGGFGGGRSSGGGFGGGRSGGGGASGRW
ncbi:MAG: hypothetical protein UY07_C0005G0014 [Parcubacteria group bacterium GW2011_GWA1_47_8]|nr:MAG: hypothetical protein UY07_C0005G0014 [Parcubacteria group bacterium GW2011_GWA1_47_8]